MQSKLQKILNLNTLISLLGIPPVIFSLFSWFPRWHELGPILGVVILISYFIWLSSFSIFISRLVFSPTLREQLLTRLAGLKERDEREEFIVGRAARSSFLLSMAATLLLLFASTIRYTRSSLGQDSGYIPSVEVGKISIIDSDYPKNHLVPYGVSVYDFPISKSAILLLVLFTQLGSFFFYSKKHSMISTKSTQGQSK